MEKRRFRGGLVWPVILVGAGIVLLLNNLGMLPWSVWETLFRLWPVLLIAVGLDILLGWRSAWGSLFVALALLVVLAAALWLGVPQWNRVVGPLTTETINQPLDGAKSAEVQIAFGAGALSVKALNESAGLVEGQVMLSPNERLARSFRKSGDVAYFDLKSEGTSRVGTNFDWNEQKLWSLALNRDVPLKLTIRTGVGASTLDLTQLNITELDINGGVGQVTLKLPQRGQINASIEGGVGQVLVTVPRGMAVRIRTEGGLGGVSVSGNFQRSGNTYTSPGFATATARAEVKVQGGIGQVVVREE